MIVLVLTDSLTVMMESVRLYSNRPVRLWCQVEGVHESHNLLIHFLLACRSRDIGPASVLAVEDSPMTLLAPNRFHRQQSRFDLKFNGCTRLATC